MRKLWVVCVLISAASGCAAAPASAAWLDPTSNFAVTPKCSGAAACFTQAVGALDEARARLNQPPYALPGDFASLSPAEQAFVLVDLDRTAQGLRPIPGLTGALDSAAAAGVRSHRDPLISDRDVMTMASDWAGGYRNMLFAYEAWMYDDGPAWGHRHTILWPFGAVGPLAMGAAAGTDITGMPSFTMLLVQGSSGYHPTYLYTWREALAAGAGVPGSSAPVRQTAVAAVPFEIVGLRVRGRAIKFRLVASRPTRFSCALGRVSAGRVSRPRARPCGAHTRYRRLRRGIYRLEVHGDGHTLTRYVRLRA